MAQCSDIETLIQTYLDGELAEHDRLDFEHHIADCDDCRALATREGRLHAALRHHLAGAPKAPDMLRALLSRALDQEDSKRGAAQRRTRRSWILPSFASVAAAAALLLFALDTQSVPVAANDQMPLVHEVVRQRFQETPVVMQGTRNELSRSAREYLRAPVRPPRFSRTDVNLRGFQPTQVRGIQAAVFVYDVKSSTGRHQVNVHILDARNLDLRSKDRRIVGDKELWVAKPLGFTTVSYKDRQGMGYVFSSDMDTDELVDMVVSSDLLQLVDEQLRDD